MMPNYISETSFKYPPKSQKFNRAVVDFDRTYDDNGDSSNAVLYYPNYYSNETYIERYPSIYSHAGGGNFSKNFFVLNDRYFEDLRLIGYNELNLYNYLFNLRFRGYHVSLHGKPRKIDGRGNVTDPGTDGLAAIVGKDPHAVTAMVDRLADCLLLHRVTRLDLRGAPNEYVIHTPFTRAELDAARVQMLHRRIADRVTLKKRMAAAAAGIAKNGDARGRFHGAADRFFQFDLREISDGRRVPGQKRQIAFGDRTRDFTEFALVFFKKHLNLLKTKKGEFQSKYRDDLAEQWERWQIHGKPRRSECFVAANKFRTIYCPTMEELCT